MRGTFSKSIELGDEVLLRAEKSNKLSSNFCPSLLEVIQKTGERLLSETAPGLKITNLVPEALFPRDEASTGIDEKEDKRADESNKETESHRPQESIRRSKCQDRRSSRVDDFVIVVVKLILFISFRCFLVKEV